MLLRRNRFSRMINYFKIQITNKQGILILPNFIFFPLSHTLIPKSLDPLIIISLISL